LYQSVLRTVAAWGSEENIMFVVGATQADYLKEVRKIVPNHFLLVPGVGAQGGSLEEVLRAGMTNDGGLLINASRSIIYASSGDDFAIAARQEAKKMQLVMSQFLQ
jgi:orotidine-5'-phosphate decarboxylase